MYVVRTPRYRKSDPAMRWALPDRVFFACGACHILAHAFLERHESVRVRVVWIRPDTGFAGHHVFVDGGAWTFDYHGFVRPGALLIHQVVSQFEISSARNFSSADQSLNRS